MKNKDRVLEISKELKLSHIGSNISMVSVLEEIYNKKKPLDLVILDNGHAHLAHSVVRSSFAELHATQDDIKENGIHCDRQSGCDASSGSLGHGIGIGIGYALSYPNKTIYVTVSDGSMMEGSNWEALRIASDLKIRNLEIYCNFNSYTAVAKIKPKKLFNKMSHHIDMFPYLRYRQTKNGQGFEGVQGHYKTL